MNTSSVIAIRSEYDIVLARKTSRDISEKMGFGLTDVTRIVTAVSELARNIFIYAGEGTIVYRLIKNDERCGLEVICKDNGPGIKDLDEAMTEGFSTSGGLGMGLTGVRRLMDEMVIESNPGKETIVRIIKWKR